MPNSSMNGAAAARSFAAHPMPPGNSVRSDGRAMFRKIDWPRCRPSFSRSVGSRCAASCSVNTDHTVVQIFESYRDSEALVTHVQDTFSQFAEEFTALISIDGFVVYGWPDPPAKQILDGFGSVYMAPFIGYTQSDGG